MLPHNLNRLLPRVRSLPKRHSAMLIKTRRHKQVVQCSPPLPFQAPLQTRIVTTKTAQHSWIKSFGIQPSRWGEKWSALPKSWMLWARLLMITLDKLQKNSSSRKNITTSEALWYPDATTWNLMHTTHKVPRGLYAAGGLVAAWVAGYRAAVKVKWYEWLNKQIIINYFSKKTMINLVTFSSIILCFWH